MLLRFPQNFTIYCATRFAWFVIPLHGPNIVRQMQARASAKSWVEQHTLVSTHYVFHLSYGQIRLASTWDWDFSRYYDVHSVTFNNQACLLNSAFLSSHVCGSVQVKVLQNKLIYIQYIYHIRPGRWCCCFLETGTFCYIGLSAINKPQESVCSNALGSRSFWNVFHFCSDF